MLFLTGGPGESAIAYLQELADARLPRDIIVLEQRGNATATPPLECNGQNLDALASCYEHLSAATDLSQFTTGHAAADVLTLAKHEGLEHFDLYAVSYGTRVALEVMRQAPGAVTAAVLDSPYPPQIDNTTASPAALLDALDTIFDDCASDPTCNSRYPHLHATFEALIADLPLLGLSDPDTAEPVDATRLLARVQRALYDPSLIPSLPRIIATAENDPTAAIDALTPTPRIYPEGFSASDELATGNQLSVYCADENPFDSAAGTSFATRHSWSTQVIAAARTLQNGNRQACAFWPVPASPPPQPPRAARTRTLIITGRYDHVTPERFARITARSFTDAVRVSVPNAGHYASHTPCGQQVLRQFLIDPTRPPTDPCLAAPGLLIDE